MGTGKIGQILCNIIKGFGANLICYDVYESDVVKELGGKYVSKEDIFAQSDILFLMSKLRYGTNYLISLRLWKTRTNIRPLSTSATSSTNQTHDQR